MQRHTIGDLAHLTFDSLSGYPVIHSVSTRHGGTSPAPFDTLNLSRTVGDDPDVVAANIRRWHAALGIDSTHVVSASQAQAGDVVVVTSAQRGQIVRAVDALATNERGLPLMLRYADCVPILFFDPVHRAIAVAHAGWRGTVIKIVTNTVRAMEDAFASRPADLVACIGPSIGPCCYCVGTDVVDQARAAFDPADGLLHARDGKVYFDLWEANARQLREMGVERIEVARMCTAEHTDDLYSARAEGHRTGRFGALIALADN